MSTKNLIEKPEVTSPRRKKRKKKKDPYLKLNGVKKLTLSEFTQKLIGCIAGQHVTMEQPWMYIPKERIQDNLDLHEESSEFLPIKTELMKYPDKKIYIGYVVDDSKDEDEFYICTTPEAIFLVDELAAKMKQEQEERLQNAIFKTIREWTSMGSEIEVDEALAKNNRPLIEVEVEAGYPISATKKDFDIVPAEQRRDGYMELKWLTEERINNVFKKRIHAYVQVAPQYTTKEVQTTCTYPANASTQYEYVVENPAPLLAKCAKPFKQYADEHLNDINDMLRVNGVFNLYSEDYLSLIKDGDVKFVSATVVEEVKEYMSFMDVEQCKEKMIADVAFHPMWTGTVAVAYTDAAPFIYHSGPNTEDVVMKTVQGTNPVLIWSCLDGLKPKLILKSPREVIKLAFCKFDENVIVGGLRNGQIIIWDIRNKFEQVENTLVLSPAQVRNRTYMNSLISWMKNIYDVAVVAPAALSDLKYSHKGPITGINWVSPFYEFSKLGRLTEVPDNKPHSMQFVTGGEDGTILIWDLLKLPQIAPGGFKPRKLKRLKKRPSALMTDSSPYAVHNLNLRPVYKTIIPRQRKKPLPMASCHEEFCPMEYEEVNPSKSKKLPPFHERIIYRPIMDKSRYKPIKSQIQIGSMEGDFVHCIWEGQDFDSGEAINSEIGQIKTRGNYHDGPLNTSQKNPAFDVTLTVGGRIFAIWTHELLNRPLIWRRSKHMYTSGEWNISQPYLFTNKVQNGDVESWSIAFDSKNPSFSLTFSSGYLSASAFHTLRQRKTIYAAADKLGSLRLFIMPEDTAPGTLETKNKKFLAFMQREIVRKTKFLEWQANWNKRAADIVLQAQKVKDEETEIEVEVENEVKIEPKEEKPKKEESTKSKKAKQSSVNFIEKIIQQKQLQEEIRIKDTIIAKKQLDTKELERRRKPLQKLEEENERKKKKQKQRLREGENIFMDTVSSLFPDVTKVKPPPPPDPYALTTITKPVCQSSYDEFLTVKEDSAVYISKNPYNYSFNWRQVLATGRERKELMTDPNGDKKKSFQRRRATRLSVYSTYEQQISSPAPSNIIPETD